MNKNKISKEEAEKIVKEVYNVADFCRKVGWKPVGGNYRTFYKYVKEYNLDTSHFTGNKTNIGGRLYSGISNEDYFKKDKLIKGTDLLKRLINKAGFEYKCDKCGITEWQGQEIKLQVHHIDGDHFNNELSNLQILCPNCHSQTDNYGGKANKKGICTHSNNYTYKHVCKICGKPMQRASKTGLCAECYRKQEQQNSKCPSKEQLLQDIKNMSMVKVGKKYGVSDNTIRKWCKRLEIILK